MNSVTLTKEQEFVYNLVENSKTSMFITGRAGTGKSYLIRYILSHTKKKTALAAPTGIAALNIGGVTINTLFKLGKDNVFDKDKESCKYLKGNGFNSKVIEVIKNTELLIIDEVSMMKIDMFETIEKICRTIRNNNDLFGGIQVLLVGDLLQLPPVLQFKDKEAFNFLYPSTSGIDNRYFIYSPLVSQFTMIELKEIMRQSDDYFKSLLNNIRVGTNLQYTLNELNKRCIPCTDSQPIIMASTNKVVDDYNAKKLNEIQETSMFYTASITGSVDKSEYPTKQKLELKVGAQVMMLNNDSERRWVNGSIGKISKIKTNSVNVIIDGQEYEVFPYDFDFKDSSLVVDKDSGNKVVQSNIKGTFTQLPIKLAWALTIHKSQGQTFDSVVLHVDNIFESGQLYTALSRCKSYDHLFLNRPLTLKDIKIDNNIRRYYNE